jgi:hypothetical protein
MTHNNPFSPTHYTTKSSPWLVLFEQFVEILRLDLAATGKALVPAEVRAGGVHVRRNHSICVPLFFRVQF